MNVSMIGQTHACKYDVNVVEICFGSCAGGKKTITIHSMPLMSVTNRA
jgi:hypothetical protein